MSDLRTQIEDMSAMVAEAERKVHEGVIVNIGSLESDVAALCARAVAGNPTDARDVQPAIADLINQLDGLASSLDAFKRQHDTT